MAQIHIRPGVVDDGRALGDAHAAAWKAAYATLFDPAFVDAAAESRRVAWPDVIAGLLTPPSFLMVAVIDGRVLAYAHVTPSDVGDRTAELRGFFAHPDAWGSGSATQLVDAVCTRLAESHDDVVLWTFAGASRARAFYEKVGFRPTGREHDEGPSNWLTGETVEQRSVEYRMSVKGWKC
jgi:GNAT superfamily N-acetyltransferase